jgi:ABC-type Na+ transport system ATPase subunit NatA
MIEASPLSKSYGPVAAVSDVSFRVAHILSEVEAICTRALVIARGRLVAPGSIDAIRALRRTASARVTVRGDPPESAVAAVSTVDTERDGGSP